ncbi:phosphoenolpyruvate--protein phosphotransferase [Candidatus Latescibacterota bacterium]
MEISPDEKSSTKEFAGIPASPGIAIGRAFIYDNEYFWIEEKNIPLENVELEKARFKDAVTKVIEDIKALRDKLKIKIGEENASIFDPHIMLLQDPAVIKETYELIEKGKNAEFAFFRTVRIIIKAVKRVEDEYMRERISDLKDILRRVSIILLGKKYLTLASLETPVIIIAPNLTPTDTALMHSSKVLAFVTDSGGRTSHATILARALEIPAVISVKTASSEIKFDDFIIVDGSRGKIYVNPDEQTIEKYREEKKRIEIVRQSLKELKDLPAVTLDGFRIGLHANIEFTDEVDGVIGNGAEGIGLYRSEYHYLVGDSPPTEDDQYKDYFQVAEKLAPKPVIVRTFDLGGDKISHIIPSEPEDNPFLGWRAIRVSLTLKELFKTQLRAIVRASSLNNLAVMFPMISCMEELDEALGIFEEIKTEIKREGLAYNPDMKVGVMIELPSAVMIAQHIARKVEFLSIGTNDLIQYSVAVDRSNDRIANLFEPFHPGILRLAKMTVDAAHAENIPVAVCGEMGGDPMAALVLLGLEIDELSMIPSFIPSVKQIIRAVRMDTAKKIVDRALNCASATEVKYLLHEELKKIKI